MHHEQYLLLTNAHKVVTIKDEEAEERGMFLHAPVVKIVRWNSQDELHTIPHLTFYYTYGYVTKAGKFVPVDSMVYYESVVDIGEDGHNPITNQKDVPGTWYSEMINRTTTQQNRNRGDFRVSDLYSHLIAKFGMKGKITCA